MEVISSVITDPYFNLASEEYFLGKKDDIFMLWRNSPAVIIGKNQNAYSEVNIDFTNQNNIAVVRRLTGGGAVFHDLGNVNFTFITDAVENQSIDFDPFISPIVKALSEYGINACADGRNDIICNGFKISGNAQCVFETPDKRKRLLHHGTLLFSADLSFLAGALNISKSKMESKGIKSVRSRVANIVSLPGYTGPTAADGFIAPLEEFASGTYGKVRPLTTLEQEEINILADRKYRLWEWNFGRSPLHTQSHSERYPFGEVQISLSAKGGVIEDISISGDFFGISPVPELETRLIGCKLEPKELFDILSDCDKYIAGSKPDDIIKLICC